MPRWWRGGIDAGIKAGLTSAAYGTSFDDAFFDSLSASVTSALLADVQTLIGDQGLVEGSAGHAFLHGLAGCGFAEASDGDCAAGFAAGVTGSLYAGFIDQSGAEANLDTAELLGAFAGFAFSSGQGQNVSLAGQVSQSGVENNYLFHQEALERMQAQNALAECQRDGDCSAETVRSLQLRIDELNALDQSRDDALRTACDANPQGADCLGRVKELAYAVQWFYDAPDPWGIGSAARQFELDYLNGSFLLEQGMDSTGGLAAMVEEWNESIALLNEYRPSYETVAAERFTNLALIYGTDIAMTMLGGAIFCGPRVRTRSRVIARR